MYIGAYIYPYMHQIENETLRVQIREYGAELTSIYNKKTGIEHLWNADEKFWPWHAPVLFPIVGRVLNDEISVDGLKYPLEKHGLARKLNFKVLERSESKIVFALTYSDETLAIYPYKFEFLIAYKLDGNKLVCDYEVLNRDSKDIYFSLGGHPAFNVPFNGVGQYEDYYIEFEQVENISRHHIDGEGFFDGRVTPVLQNSNELALESNIFSDDAYIFKDLKSRKVTIKSKLTPHTLSVAFKGFDYLGIWAKVGAPYVCIEPWLGCADTAGKPTDFKDKEGVLKLRVGERLNREIVVEAN